MRYSMCDESMRLIYITYICIHGEGTKLIANMHVFIHLRTYIRRYTHIVLAHNARTQYIYTHTYTYVKYKFYYVLVKSNPNSTTNLKKGANSCMLEGCGTCVHLTMFTTILCKCSLMFWSPILLFGQVITIPINPKPVDPTSSIRPFKPSFDEEYVGATI